MSWIKRNWRVLAGGAVSLVLLWLAFRGVDWAQVGDQLVDANWLLIIASLASVVLTAWLKAIRWRLTFWPDHRRLSVRNLCGIFFGGQVLNAVIPTRVGEVARAWMIGESEGVSKAQALWTAAVEKILDALVLLVIIVGLSFGLDLPTWLKSATWTLAIALAVVLVGLGVALAVGAPVQNWIARLEERFRWLAQLRAQRLVQVVLDSLRQLRSPRALLGLAIWSFLAFMTSSGTNWLVARALGIPLAFRACLLLLAVLQISAVVPIPTSPGRVGLYHTLCILVLAIFGYQRDLALGYSLVLHLVVYLPMMVLGPLAIYAHNASWADMRALLRAPDGDRGSDDAHGSMDD